MPVPYLDVELREEYRVIFSQLSFLIDLDYNQMSDAEKKANANRLIQCCTKQDVQNVLNNDYLPLINNLMFSSLDSDNPILLGVSRLNNLANGIGSILNASGYLNSTTGTSTGIESAIDSLRRFQFRLSSQCLPFSIMLESNAKIQQIGIEMDAYRHSLQEKENQMNSTAETLINKIEAIKDKASLDQVGILGIFSAVAFVFTGGISFTGEATRYTAETTNPVIAAILSALLGLILCNMVSILLWFISILMGKQEQLRQFGLSLWFFVNAILCAFAFGIAIFAYLCCFK